MIMEYVEYIYCVHNIHQTQMTSKTYKVMQIEVEWGNFQLQCSILYNKQSEGNGRHYLAAWVYLITHFLSLYWQGIHESAISTSTSVKIFFSASYVQLFIAQTDRFQPPDLNSIALYFVPSHCYSVLSVNSRVHWFVIWNIRV